MRKMYKSENMIKELSLFGLNKKDLSKVEEKINKSGFIKFIGFSKNEDLIKKFYRNGYQGEQVDFIIHFVNMERLINPVLTISLEKMELDFEGYISDTPIKPFKGCFNFTNRGMLNTGSHNLLSRAHPKETSGISSYSLGLNLTTLAPYSGAEINIYKHFNLHINNKSIYFRLLDGEQDIIQLMNTIHGKAYMENIFNFLEKEVQEEPIDGFAKQIIIPFDGSYVSITPMFNHFVISSLSELTYEKSKKLNTVIRKMGGTQPGNISHVNTFEKGSVNQFCMSFPRKNNSNAFYHLKNKSIVNPALFWINPSLVKSIKSYIKGNSVNSTPNSVLRSLANSISKKVTLISLSHIEEYLLTDMPEGSSFYNFGYKMKSKKDRHDFVFKIIESSLSNERTLKLIMTAELMKNIDSEVYKHV